MIEMAVKALAKRLSTVVSERLGEKHQVHFSMTSESSREVSPNKTKDTSQNVSFLTDLNVNKSQGGENRRDRRASVAGKGDENYTVWNIAPVELTLNWKIPMYKGQDSVFKFFPMIMSLDNGDLNFVIAVKLGNDSKSFPIVVQWDSDNISQPDLEGEVNTDSTPNIEVQLKLLNVYSILSRTTEEFFKSATVEFIVGANITDPDDPSLISTELQI